MSQPSEPLLVDGDDVTIRDDRGDVVVQLYRHSGRAKVYVMGPSIESTSLDPGRVRALIEWLTDSLSDG